jgi:serine-aspartate repeat-containing protein C/D/E
MPTDVAIKVWNDLNGNGIQDNEPGISGVQLQIVTANNNLPLTSSLIAAGSTCHQTLTTDSSGLVTFLKCPKATDLRAKVINAPAGSIPTTLVPDTGKAEVNSDLMSNGLSTVFNLLSFTGPTSFTAIDLGYQMPKDIVVRVWNDTDKDGIQDDNEKGINNIPVRIMFANGSSLFNAGGNCHQDLRTDGNGRILFTKCPMGVALKAKVLTPPVGLRPSPKRAGNDNQKNSACNPDHTTDTFVTPADVGQLYDKSDFGYCS